MDNRLEIRESLMLKAMFMDQSDMKAVDALDTALCEALGIDKDDNPPHFIFDSLNAT